MDLLDDAAGVGGSVTRLVIDGNILNGITAYTAAGHDPDEAIEVEYRGAYAGSGTLDVDIVDNFINSASFATDERWDGNGITVGTAGASGLTATVTADVSDNLVDFCEDAGIQLKADESVTVNVRAIGNTLTSNTDGMELSVEGDPYRLRTYFEDNSAALWDLEENASGIWELGVTAPNGQIGNTLTTPANAHTLRPC